MSEILLGVLRMPADLFWADDPVLRSQHDAIRREAAVEIERLTAELADCRHERDRYRAAAQQTCGSVAAAEAMLDQWAAEAAESE